MNSAHILFETKPNFFQEVSIPLKLLDKWIDNENSLNNLFSKIAERVYYNADKNIHKILPNSKDIKKQNKEIYEFHDKLNEALDKKSPLMIIPAFGKKN